MAIKVLALDVGSSSVKAALWDGQRFSAQTRVGYETEYPQPNWVEIPADRILAAVVRAGKEVLRGTKAVDAISFCALSSAVVVTDEKGSPRIGAITHQDRRSVNEAQWLVERFGKAKLLSRTGNLPYPGGIGSSTLAWIHQNRPDVLAGKSRVGQISTLVGHLLTGEWHIDPSQAVFLGLWDIRKRMWDSDLCEATGVKVDALPVVKWADEISGRLTPALAKRWGIPAGAPVVGGFVDTSAAILPTAMKPGQLIHNTGSTDVLAVCIEKPHPEDGILCRPVGVGATFVERWLAVRVIAAAGSAFAWARKTLYPGLSDKAWNKLLQKVCEEPWDDPRRGTFCDPSFAGDRTSIYANHGATFHGLTLGSTRDDMLRGIELGLVAHSLVNYRRLARIQTPLRTVYAMGSLKGLANAMHTAWPLRHRFVEMTGDSLEGLVLLAKRVVG